MENRSFYANGITLSYDHELHLLRRWKVFNKQLENKYSNTLFPIFDLAGIRDMKVFTFINIETKKN